MYFQSPENSVDPLAGVDPTQSQGARTSKTYGSASIRVLTNKHHVGQHTLDLNVYEDNSQTYSSASSLYLDQSLRWKGSNEHEEK
jgi:hypothetical protein